MAWVGYSFCVLATKCLMTLNSKIGYVEIMFICGVFLAILYSLVTQNMNYSLFKIP